MWYTLKQVAPVLCYILFWHAVRRMLQFSASQNYRTLITIGRAFCHNVCCHIALWYWYKDVWKIVLSLIILIISIFKYLKCHQDFKQWQKKKEEEDKIWEGELLKWVQHTFLPSKIFQARFGKFESINNLSDRKPFHSFTAQLT